MTVYSKQNLHTEEVVQHRFIDQLVKLHGYERRDPKAHYDRALALDKELVLRFLQTSQPDQWAKLAHYYPGGAEAALFQQLEMMLREHGTLHVLREGIKFVPAIHFAFCFLRPASGLEPKRVQEYESNILSVMAEVEYSSKNNGRLDVATFVNGLPVATLEFKNLLTGSNFRDAERQYRKDRRPAGEPLLSFKRGALVHFALDEDNVSMTTRLENGATRFLPFNRGRNRGAGNPDVEGEFRVAYLWKDLDGGEAVFSRGVLLDVIGRFLLLGAEKKAEAFLIFPRFHQLDAVRRLMADAGTKGVGRNYLIQHSAGSGKSNTIGWVAHHAINLHDAQDKPVFDTAVIVTDRVVLDRQLQKTVSQFERTKGVVKTIDGTSRQLKEAIAKGARIIVTTIQKFSTDHLKEISGQSARRFAVILDEAHSSQSGKSAQAMTDALTREPGAEGEEIEKLIADHQKSRGPQSNISFFAFTATPRNVTLERFGTKDAKGDLQAFHLYSMKQAIEEGFILDVLKNYTTYKAYYELEKAIEANPKFGERQGQRKVALYASVHPTAIGQKVEVIVEHFRKHVAGLMGGKAKAMIVTASREQAFKYFTAVRKYIKEMGYSDLRALVAFSGELEIDGQTVTEAQANGFAETELPSRFDGVAPGGTPYPEQYHLLIVAEKYQTGFDQPKLCAMYVDRKLAGLQAVQTLSRLNRIAPDKTETHILDFQNTIPEIKEAFSQWFDVTELEETTDPNQIYDLESRLYGSGFLDKTEIGSFAEVFFKGPLSPDDRIALEKLARQAADRFGEGEEEAKEQFRLTLKSYLRFYGFISQIWTLGDTDLEKLYVYGSWLTRLLPNRDKPPEAGITDDLIRLHAFRLEQREKGSASLSAGDAAPLQPIRDFGVRAATEEEHAELSEILRVFNDRYGTEFTADDLVGRYGVVAEDVLSEEMKQKLRNNPPDVTYRGYAQAFMRETIVWAQKGKVLDDAILADADLRERVTRFFFNRARSAPPQGGEGGSPV